MYLSIVSTIYLKVIKGLVESAGGLSKVCEGNSTK